MHTMSMSVIRHHEYYDIFVPRTEHFCLRLVCGAADVAAIASPSTADIDDHGMALRPATSLLASVQI